MTTMLASAPALLHRGVQGSLLGGVDGEPTLDDVIVGAWEGLAAHRAVACPVCGGNLRPQYGQHALAHGGCCEDCGSALR
jgi:hypothetical protein